MKTYNLEFKKNGHAVFVNEDNKKDKINANEVLRFGTLWTGEKEDYTCTGVYFKECNCFIQHSYSIDFYQLSDCGEILTSFAQ
jgi:hypothetical protein